MEGNFERDSTSLIGKFPNTVTTLYHAHNSNVFKSSESSVQITSAVIGQQTSNGGEESSKTSQNFCELDIVSRREKERSTISTVAETTNFRKSGGVFRKTLCENEQNKSGVLCLANLVKGVDEDYCKPIITRTREDRPRSPIKIGDSNDPRQKQLDDFFKLRKEEIININSTGFKKSRAKESIPESSITNPIKTSTEQVPMKFADIVQARTMYFSDLPNQSVGKKKRRHKHNTTIVVEKQDSRLGRIFVNKIEGEYPTMSSLEDTESSIPIKLKPEASFGSINIVKRKEKRHDNSPLTEEPSIITKINKESTSKGKHKKKHVMKQDLNCDFVPCKEEKLDDSTKVEVLYKKKSDKKKNSDKKSNKHSSKSPEKLEEKVKDKSEKKKDTKTKINEASSKNLKTKDPSHKSRKSSPVYSKNYDQNNEKGSKELIDKNKKRSRKEIKDPKKYETRSVSYSHQSRVRDKKSKVQFSDSKKLDNDDDCNPFSFEEAEIKAHFANLLCNNPNLIGEIYPKEKIMMESNETKKDGKKKKNKLPENIIPTQTTLQPQITTSQNVGVKMNNYMGYFVPPQVAERFSRKNTTPHSVIPERLKSSKQSSPEREDLPKLKRSKSCVAGTEDFESPILSKTSSEIEFNIIDSPRKKRSKSVVTKEIKIDKNTLVSIESREHLQEELKKLHMIQQSDDRKRNFKNGNNRLKPRLASKEEQEAILNLPIFQNEVKSSTNSLSGSDISGGIKPSHPEDARFIRSRETSPRREVSLSQLNVKPLSDFYKSPRIKSERFEICDDMNMRKSEMTTDRIEIDNKKFECTHMILGEKVTEICNKIIDDYGNVIEGFTVSGVEPPKKLKYGKLITPKHSKTNNLHTMFFPSTKIVNLEIEPKGIFGHPEKINSPEQSESTITADSLEKSKKNENVSKSSPVQVKTKKKLLPFESKKKRKICDIKLFKKFESFNQIGKSLSNLVLDASSSDDVNEKIESAKRSQQSKSRSLNRINSAVKMMESSLQIIKEESQSTDSSAKKSDKKEKISITDIKQTQTELVISDLERMKEIINYFYQVIEEPRKNIVNCLQDPRDIITKLEIKKDNQINQSSTETSSCCEQFKNMVKNVKPKFNTLRRLSSDCHQKQDIKNSSSHQNSTTKLTEYSPSTSCDTCALISSGKFKPQKRTFSVEHIRPNQSNSPTRDLLCNLRASKSIHNAVPEKQDKGISTDHKPEIKSSTSISDFSSLIVSLCETEKVRLMQEVDLYQDGAPRRNEEKSIQCTLTDDNCKTDFDYSKDVNECLNKKMVENKSLQTSCNLKFVGNENNSNKVSPKISSHTFLSHSHNHHDHKRRNSCPSRESMSGSKMSRKHFRNQKNENSVEVDYVNLLKLERHLEQVLGLYPTVCKAIRAHMERNPRAKPAAEKNRKDPNRIYYASQDTLATTIDTITEYNVMERDVMTRSSQRWKFPINKYLYENHFKFRDGDRRNRSRYSLFASSGRNSSRNLEFIESPYPYTDTSSSSSRIEQYRNRKLPPPSHKYNLRNRKYRRGNLNFYNTLASDDIRDNWSIGSPLYSISTPSLSISKNEFMLKTKSKSLTMTQVLNTQLTTSKSLMELSSNKIMNRRAIIQKLQDDLMKGGKGKSFRLGTQQVFVLSLDSAMSNSNLNCKGYQNDQKNQEKHQQKVQEKNQQKAQQKNQQKAQQKNQQKAQQKNQQRNQQRNQQNNQQKNQQNVGKDVEEDVEQEVEQFLQLNYDHKIKINEDNCHNLLFSGNMNTPKQNRNYHNRPFYIHNHNQSSSSDFDFLDSIEQPNKQEVEEDLGNFSADSLESACSPADEALNYTMELLQSNLLAPKQNFFVYTSRVNYDSNLLKSQNFTNRDSARKNSAGRNSTKSKSSSPKRKSPNRKFEEAKSGPSQITNKPDDGSNTLISESGYETSNRTKSIKNFFKKGGSLLDIFRQTKTTKSKNIINPETIKEKSSNTNLTSFSTLYSKNQDESCDESTTTTSNTKIFWANLAKNKSPKTTFLGPQDNNKSTSTTANKKCSAKFYEKQMSACHEYAEKVVQESQMKKRDGYEKQYQDFEEIPLELLIGRKINRKGSPQNIQMNTLVTSEKAKSNPETPRYPYYESDHILQEPNVTFVDDKIVFQSSKTKINYPSKTTSPFKNLKSCNDDVCKYRRSKSPKQDEINHKFIDQKCINQKCINRKLIGDKLIGNKLIGNKIIAIKENRSPFRRKRSPELGCRCDDEDSTTIKISDSYKSNLAEEGLQTEDDITENQFSDEDEPNQNANSKRKRIEPFSCCKRKRTIEMQIQPYNKSKATEPIEEIQKETEARKRTKETHMDVKPFHKTKGTEPMPSNRIRRKMRETQKEDDDDDDNFLKTRRLKIKRSISLGRAPSQCICSGQNQPSNTNNNKQSINNLSPDASSLTHFKIKSLGRRNIFSHLFEPPQCTCENPELPKKRSTSEPSSKKPSKSSFSKNINTQTPPTMKGGYTHDYQSIKSVESEKDVTLKLIKRNSSLKPKRKASRTVYTQIKQDPVLESMYKLGYEPQEKSGIIELLSPRTIQLSDPKLSSFTKIEPKQSEIQHKKGPILKRIRSETMQSTKTSTLMSTGEVYLQPQEELLPDDVSNKSLIEKIQDEEIKVTKAIDSLTVLHKSYGVEKEVESIASISEENKARSISISTTPIIHIRPEEQPQESSSVHSCASFIDTIMNEIVGTAFKQYWKNMEHIEETIIDTELFDDQNTNFEEDQIQDLEHKETSEEIHKGLTDKEVFNKLLTSFEKEDEIAVRLSKDETFFQEQIQKLKKDSDESLQDQVIEKAGHDNIYADDLVDKHRSTHFWEEKMKAMRAKEDNPVKTDDIGTCFARGFRPDNIALSGDACFNLNKQDKIKFTKGMLTNEESIIDFSERETPLDYLLALGFMVDEASNALKDDDIRSRLLAAITEARVWINKITTTQGTLLYLVAYKSRPKTMRYFLQLVEAIINKRINNAIKLDGFLRVLEKVEEGEIQMINILGADKFEDEENEEKIVKKQLRQLFITVYKIAEKEAQQKGNELSQQAIVLLRILAAKYRAGLHPHLELIARYIGQDLLNTETQLEAAMIFLSRLDTAEVKLKEFEAYCDIKCEKKKKQSKHDAVVEDLQETKSQVDNQIQLKQPVPPEEDGMEEIEEDYIPLRRGDKGGKKAQIMG